MGNQISALIPDGDIRNSHTQEEFLYSMSSQNPKDAKLISKTILDISKSNKNFVIITSGQPDHVKYWQEEQIFVCAFTISNPPIPLNYYHTHLFKGFSLTTIHLGKVAYQNMIFFMNGAKYNLTKTQFLNQIIQVSSFSENSSDYNDKFSKSIQPKLLIASPKIAKLSLVNNNDENNEDNYNENNDESINNQNNANFRRSAPVNAKLLSDSEHSSINHRGGARLSDNLEQLSESSTPDDSSLDIDEQQVEISLVNSSPITASTLYSADMYSSQSDPKKNIKDRSASPKKKKNQNGSFAFSEEYNDGYNDNEPDDIDIEPASNPKRKKNKPLKKNIKKDSKPSRKPKRKNPKINIIEDRKRNNTSSDSLLEGDDNLDDRGNNRNVDINIFEDRRKKPNQRVVDINVVEDRKRKNPLDQSDNNDGDNNGSKEKSKSKPSKRVVDINIIEDRKRKNDPSNDDNANDDNNDNNKSKSKPNKRVVDINIIEDRKRKNDPNNGDNERDEYKDDNNVNNKSEDRPNKRVVDINIIEDRKRKANPNDENDGNEDTPNQRGTDIDDQNPSSSGNNDKTKKKPNRRIKRKGKNKRLPGNSEKAEYGNSTGPSENQPQKNSEDNYEHDQDSDQQSQPNNDPSQIMNKDQPIQDDNDPLRSGKRDQSNPTSNYPYQSRGIGQSNQQDDDPNNHGQSPYQNGNDPNQQNQYPKHSGNLDQPNQDQYGQTNPNQDQYGQTNPNQGNRNPYDQNQYPNNTGGLDQPNQKGQIHPSQGNRDTYDQNQLPYQKENNIDQPNRDRGNQSQFPNGFERDPRQQDRYPYQFPYDQNKEPSNQEPYQSKDRGISNDYPNNQNRYPNGNGSDNYDPNSGLKPNGFDSNNEINNIPDEYINYHNPSKSEWPYVPSNNNNGKSNGNDQDGPQSNQKDSNISDPNNLEDGINSGKSKTRRINSKSTSRMPNSKRKPSPKSPRGSYTVNLCIAGDKQPFDAEFEEEEEEANDDERKLAKPKVSMSTEMFEFNKPQRSIYFEISTENFNYPNDDDNRKETPSISISNPHLIIDSKAKHKKKASLDLACKIVVDKYKSKKPPAISIGHMVEISKYNSAANSEISNEPSVKERAVTLTNADEEVGTQTKKFEGVEYVIDSSVFDELNLKKKPNHVDHGTSSNHIHHHHHHHSGNSSNHSHSRRKENGKEKKRKSPISSENNSDIHGNSEEELSAFDLDMTETVNPPTLKFIRSNEEESEIDVNVVFHENSDKSSEAFSPFVYNNRSQNRH